MNKDVLPRDDGKHEDSIRDVGIMNSIDLDEKVNLPALIIKHIQTMIFLSIDPYGLAYNFSLPTMFEDSGVVLQDGKLVTKNDMITAKTLGECYCLLSKTTGVNASSPVTPLMMNLKATQEKKSRTEGRDVYLEGLANSLSSTSEHIK